MSSLKKKLFLSKAESEYLTAKQQFNDGYTRIIKSRLQKKIKVFVNQEPPILVQKGYVDVTEFRHGSVTENCNREEGGDSLGRIPPQTGVDSLEISNHYRVENKKKEKEWAGQDLNSRSPPCQGGILTRLDHRPNIQWKNLLPKYML